jgi:hypothetical protein
MDPLQVFVIIGLICIAIVIIQIGRFLLGVRITYEPF